MSAAIAQEQQQGQVSVRFGPGGGTYRVVTTSRETTGRHFAFEAAEPPGHRCIRTRRRTSTSRYSTGNSPSTSTGA
jgi:hypothetical protein